MQVVFVPRGVHAFDLARDAADAEYSWPALDVASIKEQAEQQHKKRQASFSGLSNSPQKGGKLSWLTGNKQDAHVRTCFPCLRKGDGGLQCVQSAAPARKASRCMCRLESLCSTHAITAVQVRQAGHCLRVEVLRAEGLPAMDTFGGSDAYAVLTVQSEAGLQMFKTATIRGSQVLAPCVSCILRKDSVSLHLAKGQCSDELQRKDMMKTPTHTSSEIFDHRLDRYSQLSPSIRAPTRNNKIQARHKRRARGTHNIAQSTAVHACDATCESATRLLMHVAQCSGAWCKLNSTGREDAPFFESPAWPRLVTALTAQCRGVGASFGTLWQTGLASQVWCRCTATVGKLYLHSK